MTTEYITKGDYRRQKSALTRAINSKDPLKVLNAVEKALDEWHDSVWPDDWSRWSVALYDAWHAYERSDALYSDAAHGAFYTNCDRFGNAYRRFM